MKRRALVLLTTAILISTMFPLVAFGQKSGGTIVAAITGDPKFFNQDWSRAGGSPAQMVDSNIYSVLIGVLLTCRWIRLAVNSRLMNV
jgi:hypothetical protein